MAAILRIQIRSIQEVKGKNIILYGVCTDGNGENMAENFNSTVESLFNGMNTFLTSKTVVGDAVKYQDGTIIVPFVDVTFGVAAGAFSEDKKNNAGGGMGGKLSPSSVLVIQDGHVRLVNIKNQDTVTKVIDMVPDLIDKFKKDPKQKEKEMKTDAEVKSEFDNKQ